MGSDAPYEIVRIKNAWVEIRLFSGTGAASRRWYTVQAAAAVIAELMSRARRRRVYNAVLTKPYHLDETTRAVAQVLTVPF